MSMEQPNGRSDVPVARKRKQQQQPSTGDNAPKTRSVTQRERLLAFETEARNFTLRLRADAEAQIELNRVLFRTVRRMVRRDPGLPLNFSPPHDRNASPPLFQKQRIIRRTCRKCRHWTP